MIVAETVRGGVLGSCHDEFTDRSQRKIATAIAIPWKDNREPCRCSHPRWAAQLMACWRRHRAKPATIPIQW